MRLLAASTITILAAAGCAGPFARPEDNITGRSLERLHVIDTVRLEDQSRAAGLTPEQALAAEAARPVRPAADVSLADVRAAAVGNNLDLEVELVNPAIAQTVVDAEEAKFEATFVASARQIHSDEAVEFSTQSSQADISRFDLGVNIPLRTGGRFNVDFPLSRSDTDNAFSVLNPAFDASIAFSISQPLLRGAGVRANTDSIRIARYERKISDAQTRLEVIRILANADRAYWLVYAARRQLEVRQEQYELAMEQLRQARRRVEAGTSPDIEITRAESGAASRLEDILVAETILLRRQRDLKRIMNRPDLPLEEPTTLVTTTAPSPVYLDLDASALGEFAVANRMEMLELELRLAIDAANIDLEKNAALPLFTLDYSYNINGLASSFGGAFEQIGDSQFTGWTVGLQAEIPIGNEAAKARVHRAVLVRLQRLSTRDLRKLAILQEVYNALDLLNQEWQRILAARQSVILAGRTWEGEKRQFEAGLRTSTDVLDAAARLGDAQSSEVQALADYEIARVDIAFGTGTLLGYGKVRFEPVDLPRGKDDPAAAVGGVEAVP
jgi:outer membrane protein TolC